MRFNLFCPGIRALTNIVASPSFTAYHWATLSTLFVKKQPSDYMNIAIHFQEMARFEFVLFSRFLAVKVLNSRGVVKKT